MAPLKRPFLLIAALWVAALLTYSNSFRGGLVFDSVGLILEDSRLATADIHRILTEDYWSTGTHSGLYRPLTKLSFLLNSPASPAGYHLFNFLIHAINITLVYLLGLTFFRRDDQAFLLAALWGLHPVLAESVTNVVGRADLLAGFGVLAGMLCHIRRQWMGLALASAIGVSSKESAVTLLAAMALYDFAFRKRNWAGYACAAIPFALFAIARQRVFDGAILGSVPFTDNPIAGAGFWSGRLTAIKVIGRYFALLLWPGQLSCDYSYNEVPLAGWGDFAALLSLVLVAAIGVAAFYCLRRRPLLFLFIGFFFATLLPVSNLIIPIGSIMAERFLYLPALGFAGCVVLLAHSSRGRWALAAACALLAIRTNARNQDWRDQRSLWASAAIAAPDSYKTHLSSAGGLPLQDAKKEIDRALEIVDTLPDSRNAAIVYINAGGLYRDLRDDRKALALLERGERVQNAAGTVRYYQLYEELGLTWLRLEDLEQAAGNLFKGSILAPSYPEIAAELRDVYSRSAIPCAVENGAINLACEPVHQNACAAAQALAQAAARKRFKCEP